MWWMLLAQVAVAGDAVPVREYAMQLDRVTQMRHPNPFARSNWVDQRTVSWLHVQMRIEGEQAHYTQRLCRITSEKIFGTTTVYSQAFLDAVPVEQRTASMVDGAFTITYDDALGVEGDPDGDGHPGVTVRIEQAVLGKGDIYVGQQSTTSLTGQLQPDGRIEGQMSWTAEAVVHGATRWWLKLERATRPSPDPEAHSFEMVPLTAGSSCIDVLQRGPGLFAQGQAGAGASG